MAINTNRTLTSLLATLLALPLAHAQDDTTEAEDTARRYPGEWIVCTSAENVSVGTGLFPPDEPVVPEGTLLPEEFDALREGVEVDAEGKPIPNFGDMDVGDEAAEEEPGPSVLDIDPVLMIDDDLSLQRALEQLQRLDAYEPILHTGWTQTTLPREASVPLELAYFGKPPDGLVGNFMLYLGRYLHLVVDLTLDAPGQIREYGEPIRSFGDERLQYETDRMREDGIVRYRIQEDRIVKNGDVRYFDHPKFGVIAKVTRVEEPQEDPQNGLDSLVTRPVQ